jgi:lipid II isoglutaminyl synthase (glutamine-hydrolysing)
MNTNLKPEYNQPVFYITHLYPEKLNIYGDMGNIIAMQYRLRKLGFKPIYQAVEIGQELPSKTDWYFIGGGQDKEQLLVGGDLLSKKRKLFEDISQGVGLLAICGGHQLLGKKFLTGNGELVNGLGLFEITTSAPLSHKQGVGDRCIGNVVTECQIPELRGNTLVGFENHSGQTELLSGAKEQGGYPLGKVVVGHGNSLNGGDEGYVLHNAVGTYLHGSCLPKNPALADWFIHQQFKRKRVTITSSIDDDIANAVHEHLTTKN